MSGLLYLEKDDRVVETKLRFGLKRECVININSASNNIMALELNILIKKDSLSGKLSKEQIANIELEGFKFKASEDNLLYKICSEV